MKNKNLLIIGIVVVALIGGFVFFRESGLGERGSGVGGLAKQAVVQVGGRFIKGELAPKVVAVDFDGNEVNVSENYGKKAVIIDFWAGWCPFCIAEMPELQKAQDKYGEDLVMIGAHRTDTEDKSIGLKFAEDRGVTYTLLQDGDGSLYKAAGGIGMPVAVFIDKDGIVQDVKSGPKTVEEIAEKVGAIVE